MSAISITAANVAQGSNANTSTGLAAVAITAGQAVYINSSNLVALADADLSSAGATVVGVALHGAAAGQPITYQVGGDITIGATLAVGTIYVLGATAGSIHPSADLTTSWRTSIIGVAKTTSVMTLRIFNSDAVNG